jgi:hypothetical protein
MRDDQEKSELKSPTRKTGVMGHPKFVLEFIAWATRPAGRVR